MQNLRVTLIQSNILWEKIDDNLSNFSKKINQVKGQTDVIILPEVQARLDEIVQSRLQTEKAAQDELKVKA